MTLLFGTFVVVFRKSFLSNQNQIPMTSTLDEGAYTKTSAYNFIKRLVGIKPKDPLNKRVFNLCFRGTEHVFLPRKQEDEIITIFNKIRVQERNSQYWRLKTEEQDPQRASEVLNETITLLEKEFKEAA